ncbi:PKD domain protein [Flavobacterium anhuiense]|uniref:PKD domain protein n=1 Tax=Flavobacterium anhuiense TaxID=459526 RepID=A0AAC9D749_9FLAO|nr:T9SS type A sorting domain-containing protein [Flavobacterium anhuiense]AOC96677.1 PKD domain protein [Flavobacterium anhuiense]
MKKKLLLLFTFFCVFSFHQNLKGQTLGPGDIAFIGFDTGGQDGFSFIALKNLPAGEIVYFTEEGLFINGWIGSNEPHIRWTIPPNVTVGTIISVIETATNNVFTATASVIGDVTSSFVINPTGPVYSFNLSAGDQMLAYQSVGNVMRPTMTPVPDPIPDPEPVQPNITFIAGVHGDYNVSNYDVVTHWNNPNTTGNLGGGESIKPWGLENGKNCVALFPGITEQGQFFAKYTGSLTGTATAIRTSINTYSNWIITTPTSTPAGSQGILPSNYTAPNITPMVAPTVTTNTPVTSFGAVSAVLGGSNDNGGDTGTINRGVVWSLTTNPVISGPGVTNVFGTAGTGAFTINVLSLPPATTIYYRAYAQNSIGTSYGNTVSFTTNSTLSATQSQTIACNGTNNATATVNVSGGKSPYTYAWTNGSTAATATGLEPNITYNVLITDSEQTTISKNFTIAENPAILGGLSVTNVACNGGNNGSIDLTPSGGSGSYTYNWGGGVTTQDRTGLVAGTYSVTITDSNNCSTIINNIVVSQPTALSAAIGGGKTDVSCNGGANGTATVAPTGGAGSYTYSWNTTPVQTTATATGLIAGTYTVTVTDANNCQTTRTFTINQPPLLNIATGGGKTDVSCNGGANGTATVVPTGGAGGYTYSWNTTPVQTTATATGLAAGNYTVTVTDANSCQATRSFTINQPATALNAASGGGKTDVSCNGGANGTATVAPTGGAGGYTYSWNTTPVQTTATATGLAAGTYTVTVTDANNCQATRSFTIDQPATALSLLTGGGKTDVSCNGGANGTATVAPTGGAGSYTYSWNTTPVQTTATATGLAAGTYTVTVTDANSCQATRSFTINQPATALSLITGGGKTDVSCNGGANGTATVVPTGGTPGYTYSWNTTPVQTTATATGLAAGTYTVTVTDANSCQATRSFTINQPPALNLSIGGGKTDASCNGGANGTATVVPTGGAGGYTYSWNTTPVQTTATAMGLTAGTYTVTVTDSNSCQATRSFTISEPPALTASNGGQTDVSCNGGSNGSATVNVTGGTGTYTYQWAPSGGTAATATGLSAGTYIVTVKDANNCQTSQSFTINQPPILSATQTHTDVLCNGGATGTATVTASGGTGNYTYLWSPSGGTAATATGLTVGNYSCLITDANGCSITKNFTINQPSVLGATTSQTNATCSVGGDASVTPFGGVGNYSYLWTPGGATTQNITNLAAGNYSCLITDGNGCTVTKNFIINTTNTLVAATYQVNVLCNGSNTGSASVIPSGAAGPFTYSWSPSGGSSDTANNLSAGNYSVTITASNGCSIVKNFTITEPSSIVITPNPQTNVTCSGGNNGSASVSVTGGTGAYSYTWSPSGGNAATATGLSAGTYTVTVKDANSCTKTQSFTITEPNALSATTSQTDVTCNGGSNGTATVNVTGGTGTYTYSWSPSGGTAATASGLPAGTYTVTVKDANLCQTTASVTITEPPVLTATVAKTDVLCNQANNGTATVTPSGGTGTYTYSWSPSGGTAATATGLSPNTYSVTVTDANGCSVTETVQITEPSALSLTDSHINVSCNGGNNGTASVVATGGTGGTGAYTYSWSPSGGSAATATGLTAGVYTVTVTDENSCSATKAITITEPDALTLTATPLAVSCHNGNNGSATVSVTGGTGAYSYSWAPSGGNAATATGLAAGTYTVTVTDDNSCTATATVEVIQPANPVNLNTAVVSGITTTGASLSGTASSDGINTDSGSCLTEVGFVYAQHANPTTADTKINVTAALGTFANSLSGLRGNRTYYVRTYAINSNGFINYGNEVSFTTQKYTLTITAATGHTKVYGTTDPVFNYTALGFANGDTNSILSGLLTRDAGENVGKYNINLGTINAGADYVIAFTGAEFEITKANQTITWNQTLEFGCSDSKNVTLTATTDSGLPVSYSIANAALGTISGSTLNITGSGSSTITATQNGDQNHNPATVVVKPIEISQSGLVIQQWANVLFFDNRSNNFVAWQWYKNGAAISGATKQYYSEIQPLNGIYYVIAKDKNGNSIKSCPIETTGTIFTKKIKIYPNPVKPNAEFTLECDFSESQLNGSEVVIYDIAGKLVQTISNVKPKNQIIAPSQTALYIVVLKLADGQLKTINLLVK